MKVVPKDFLGNLANKDVIEKLFAVGSIMMYKIVELSEEKMQPIVSDYKQGTIKIFELNKEKPEMSVVEIDGEHIKHQLCDLIEIKVNSKDVIIPKTEQAKEDTEAKRVRH